MAKHKKKKDIIAFHEYVIFILGGIVVIVIAVLSAIYSVRSNQQSMDTYKIQIQNSQIRYECLIFNTKSGNALKKMLPLTVEAGFGTSTIRISVHIPDSETSPYYIKPKSGEILYEPEKASILLVNADIEIPMKCVRLGVLKNPPSEFPVYQDTVTVNMNLKK
ncbi:MAG: hypothetical protein A2161_15385 [Candidatus Schekmanbacteria bacterium RBG_13_48_7]|uniref:Cyclophilin-like domain-containing protein n=1 Tax=Candidatus Schekmanbacteria bacterium RBG_13_48_7 TaxID=1817878 RepID=A0A1F7S1A6_9BACT|nr:MAG: hypothetical protein A2161_15385 [Candidatus Schekmanbacteria bacterium RBG_13_48_7]